MVAWQIGASGSRHNEPIRLYFYFRHAAYRAIPSHRRGYRDALPTQRNNTTESRYERVTKRARDREREREPWNTNGSPRQNRATPHRATPSRATRHATLRQAPSRPSRPPLSLSLHAAMLTPMFQRSYHHPPPSSLASLHLYRAYVRETLYYTQRPRASTRASGRLPPFSRDAVFLLPNNRDGARWSGPGVEGTRVPNVG